MQNKLKSDTAEDVELSIVLTIVSGKNSLRRNLQVLVPQIDFTKSEIIVPFDRWSADAGDLAVEFPDVRFHYIEDLGIIETADISSHQHRLYDYRRAVGLQLTRGRIIAMTEDHAVPADDWCRQIISVHSTNPFAVVGGAIENRIDRPLNWAWYYCDFGRYGRPFRQREVDYVSDVNLSYRREALMSVKEVWQNAYHETLVNWELFAKGEKLFLSDSPVVYQERPSINLRQAFKERIDWGRVFGETRNEKTYAWLRVVYAVGTIILPALLLIRVFKNMIRQNRTTRQICTTLPVALFLLTGWSLGEMLGYTFGEPKSLHPVPNAS